MAKKSNIVVKSASEFEPKQIKTEVTVGFAHTISGEGTQIHYRPDGKINPVDPDSDLAVLITY